MRPRFLLLLPVYPHHMLVYIRSGRYGLITYRTLMYSLAKVLVVEVVLHSFLSRIAFLAHRTGEFENLLRRMSPRVLQMRLIRGEVRERLVTVRALVATLVLMSLYVVLQLDHTHHLVADRAFGSRERTFVKFEMCCQRSSVDEPFFAMVTL